MPHNLVLANWKVKTPEEISLTCLYVFLFLRVSAGPFVYLELVVSVWAYTDRFLAVQDDRHSQQIDTAVMISKVIISLQMLYWTTRLHLDTIVLYKENPMQ